MRVALMLHVLGAVVWIGGMFFAYLALRPAAATVLEPPQRLALWSATLGRFFRWVWASIALILSSGFFMFAEIAGVARVPIHIHAMLYIGVVMTLIFGYVFFSPFPMLQRAVAGQDWRLAGMALNQIRIAVAVNLGLGLATIVIATVGAF